MADKTKIKPTNKKQLRFIITGSFFYGNLGSAAMVVVVVEQLKALFPNCIVALASKYPERDKEECRKYFIDNKQLSIFSTKQIRTTFLGLPLIAVYALFNKCGINLKFLLNLSGLKLFAKTDYVLDIGGITFSEERGLSGLLINSTWVLIPSLLGVPIIKLSQAFGPLQKKWFLVFTRIVLNRVSLIISRGQLSSVELEKLFLRKTYKQCSDVAFLLEPSRTNNSEKLMKKGSIIAITPSSIVYQKMGSKKYIVLFKQLIHDLDMYYPDHGIRLIAHSYKQGETLNNNDYPVCKAIWDGLPEQLRGKTTLIYGDYTAYEMKFILGQSDLLIACRFHSMVGALGMGVPTVVLGWSHKYQEVMDTFDLKTVVNYKNFEYKRLWNAVNSALIKNETYKLQLKNRIDYCKKSAHENFALLEEFVMKNEAI